MIIPVSRVDDPCIEAYREMRERDLRGRAGRFIVEGEVVLRVLLAQSRYGVDSILISQKRLAPLHGVIATLSAETPVYVAPQELLSGIVGFPIHRGVLAIGIAGEAMSPAALLRRMPDRAMIVGLIGLTNHDNVGGVFRNAAAFGADGLMLDATSCDPLYRKALRVSVGGALQVPFSRGGSPEELLEALAGAGFDAIALSPHGGDPLSEVRGSGRVALLLGTEGVGLPDAVLARARTVRIPMAAGFDSLNVATASGIALYHLSQRAEPSPTPP
jgi:tRNA G18 (ribose-2'-O)-methylase SpoU